MLLQKTGVLVACANAPAGPETPPRPGGSPSRANVQEFYPAAIDLLAQAIERVRPMLDQKLPLKARVRVLWAGTKNARSFAATDVLAAEFFELASDTGLTADLDDPVRRISGEETVRHVVNLPRHKSV